MDFRVRPEMKRVGAAGNQTRYQGGMHGSALKVDSYVNLSGTAIINDYNRLKRKGLRRFLCYRNMGSMT